MNIKNYIIFVEIKKLTNLFSMSGYVSSMSETVSSTLAIATMRDSLSPTRETDSSSISPTI